MKDRLLPVKVLDAGCSTRWGDLNREYNEFIPRSKYSKHLHIGFDLLNRTPWTALCWNFTCLTMVSNLTERL